MAWAPNYAGNDDGRDYLRLGDGFDDVEIGLAIAAASRAVDRFCNRQFGKTDAVETRTFEAEWSRRLGRYLARIDDVQTTTGLVVTAAGSAIGSSNYTLYPLNAAGYGQPWERLAVDTVTTPTHGTGPCTVDVTATFGWTAVPDAIKNATLLEAARIFQSRTAPFGIAGSPDQGSEMRLLDKVHPVVAEMLQPFRRDWPLL